MGDNINLLINLPQGFHTHPHLAAAYRSLEQYATIRTSAHNTQEEIMQDAPWADAILMWAWPNFTDEMLARTPRLRFIGHINSTQSSAAACFRRGIAVSDVRHCWSPSVAEMALTLMLAGLRKTSQHHILMRQGHEVWVEDFPGDIDPMERQLTGRTVGIVGFGGIGRRLAELLAPFRVQLKVYDPFLPQAVFDEYGATNCSIRELVQDTDVIVLCAANNSSSDHLIGEEDIQAMNSDTVVVNVGRSSLLDMAALQRRLQAGELIAMLDVFDQEPLALDSPLRQLPNAFLTPHRAGGVLESLARAFAMLEEDLRAFLRNEPRKYELKESMFHSLPN